MSKFNEQYGFVDKKSPHLFVIAEVLFGIKEAMENQNKHLEKIQASLDIVAKATEDKQSDSTNP